LALSSASGILQRMSMEISEEDFVDLKCPYCGEMNSFPAADSRVIRECLNCLNTLMMPEPGQTVGRKLPLPFDTPRIRLRQFKDDDWKDLMKFGIEDETEATSWLNSTVQARLTDLQHTFYLAVEMRSTGQLIACIGLKFTDGEFNQIWISSGTLPKYCGVSAELYAREVALRFCFEGLQVHRAIAECAGEDSELIQGLTKLGMRQEAEFIKSERNDAGEWRNVVWFAMLEDEYLSRSKPGFSS
jgi:RimJ/RimL family protein N-acetyltransferase